MKTPGIFLIIVMLFCIILCGCTDVPASSLSDAPISISGDIAFYAAMEKSELKAECEGNNIEVSGSITYYGHPIVYIGSAEEGIMFVCYLSNDFSPKDIAVGDSIVIRGRCSSTISDSVYLKGCQLSEKKNGNTSFGSAPTAAPAAIPAHTHSYSPATCDAPQTCTVCGSTNGSALGHNYVIGKCSFCGIADSNSDGNSTVWIPTNGGTKYHINAACSNMIDPEKATKDNAVDLGFEPCEKCY